MIIDPHEFDKREKDLYQWTLNHCNKDAITPFEVGDNKIDFEEGWRMIEVHGLNVLQDMLKECVAPEENISYRLVRKPFGANGVASLYTISYKMVHSSADFSEEFYNRC